MWVHTDVCSGYHHTDPHHGSACLCADTQQDTLRALARRARELERQAIEPSTRRRYAAVLKDINRWGPLFPLDTRQKVRLYFATFAEQRRKWTAVTNARVALRRLHKERGLRPPPFDHDRLADFWRGLRKACDNTQGGQDAIDPERLRKVLTGWLTRGTNSALRNAFVAAVQFWGLRRISEVTALTRRDITAMQDGSYTLLVRKQKNDPFGYGQRVPIPAVAHDNFQVGTILRRFLEATRGLPDDSPLVRTTVREKWDTKVLANDAFNRALRQALLKAGEDPLRITQLSSHSLRKGGFTALARAGVPQDCAQRLIGHSSARSGRTYLKRPFDDLRAAVTKI